MRRAQATSSCTGFYQHPGPPRRRAFSQSGQGRFSTIGRVGSKHSKPEATTTSSAFGGTGHPPPRGRPRRRTPTASSPSRTKGLLDVPNKAPNTRKRFPCCPRTKLLRRRTSLVLWRPMLLAGPSAPAGAEGRPQPATKQQQPTETTDASSRHRNQQRTLREWTSRPREPPARSLRPRTLRAAHAFRSQATMAPYLGAKLCGALLRSKFPSSQLPSQCKAE